MGIIDLVRDGLVPIDFKTVGATPTPATEAWLNEIQMVGYSILPKETVGLEPGPGELIHLVKTKTPKVLHQQLPSVTEVHLDRFRRLVDVYVDMSEGSLIEARQGRPVPVIA